MSDQHGWGPPDPQPQDPPAAQPLPPGWAPQQPPGPVGGAGGAQPPPPAPGPPPATYPPPGSYGPPGYQGYPGYPYPGHPGYAYAPPAAPKPGVIPLRPIGIGEILDGAIQCVRANPKVMLGLSAVVVTVTQLISFLIQLGFIDDLTALDQIDPETATAQDFTGPLTSYGIATLVPAMFTALATAILSGLLTVAVGRAVLGTRITAREAWDQLRPRIWRLLGLAVLVSWVPVLVVAAGLAIVILLAVLVTPFVLVLIPVPIVAAVYLYVIWWVSAPALILEKSTVFRSLARSRDLIRQAWWRTLGIAILSAIIVAVVSLVAGVPFQVAGAVVGAVAGNGDLGAVSIWSLFFDSLGQIVGLTLATPFSAAVVALAYVDRRMRREGLDLELARAASASTRP